MITTTLLSGLLLAPALFGPTSFQAQSVTSPVESKEAPAPAPPQAAFGAPPGTKLVKGGRTVIGTTVKEFEAIVTSSGEAEGFKNVYVAETPQHKVEVDDFYLGVNEVSIEQYAAFLEATGHRPPIDFGEKAILEAIKAFNEEQGRLRQEAKLAGEPFERKKFDRDAWWAANWQDAEWNLPTKLAKRPVVNVNYKDVLAYCNWAGVRPMTEFEFQRAARGGSDRPYPWGEDWDPKKLACDQAGRADAFDVGTFEDGAIDGFVDLVGNVWEWTSSPYAPYPKYEPVDFKFKRTKSSKPVEKTAIAPFEPSWLVGVGGCVGTGQHVNRCAVRRGCIRDQSANQLGFRIAMSAVPGRDLAEELWNNGVLRSFLPDDKILTLAPATLQRWMYTKGTVELGNYGIIKGYDAVMFAPIDKFKKVNTAKDLKSLTEQGGPRVIGMFHTSIPIVEPAIEPGTYFLGFRSAGKFEIPEPEAVEAVAGEGEGEKEGSLKSSLQTSPLGAGSPDGENFWEIEGFDAAKDQFFLFDSQGKQLLCFAASAPSKERLKAGVASRLTWSAFVPPKKLKKGEEPPTPLDDLTLTAIVAPRSGKTALSFRWVMKISPGTINEDW